MQLLRKIAFPISLIYAGVVHLRNLLFDWGIFASTKFSTPILCIGNLSVGGTGKTPMAAFLVELLSKDHKIAVLSRGYKRKTKGFLMAKAGVTVQDIGDEPYQLYKKYPQITVAVDAKRRRGISILEKTIQPDVILLDDAFQHRKVKPQLSILLTAHDSLYPDDWYLPTGNLRDAKNQARRAAVIVVTKCPVKPSEMEQNEILQKLNPRQYQKVLFATLNYGGELVGSEGCLPLAVLEKKQVALVTGIANPEPLVKFLSDQGIVFKHFKYPDHHFFTAKEIGQFIDYEVVITTSKDFTRLEGKVKRLYYIEVEHAFVGKDGAAFEKAIKDTLTLGRRP